MINIQKGTKYHKYRKHKLKDVYEHSHCIVCRRMVPRDGEYEEYCSDECAGVKKEKKQKKRKRYIFIIGGYIILIGVLVGISFLLR